MMTTLEAAASGSARDAAPARGAARSIDPALDPRRARALARIRRLSHVLDSQFRLPGTSFRFGVDPLIGLLPGAGDAIGLGLSAWLVWEASRFDLRRGVLPRMLGNLVIEGLVGSVPLLGDAFDAWFKANQRNRRLLEQSLAGTAAGAGGPADRSP